MQSAFVHRLFTLLMQRLMDLKCWHGNSLELAGDLHDRIKIYLKLDISEDQVAVLLEELVVDFEPSGSCSSGVAAFAAALHHLRRR